MASLLSSQPARAQDPLAREMRDAVVAIVPPQAVYIRGEDKRATIKHQPLAGYDTDGYAALFGERAVGLFDKAPTRWRSVVIDPGTSVWRELSTEDPDNDPPVTLDAVPDAASGADYLAVFRYAEFAYDVREQPKWSRGGRVYIVRFVELMLDLQLVVYDAATGAPLGTYDAQAPADVPEIQAKPTRAKAFYRCTNGALRKMRAAVARGN